MKSFEIFSGAGGLAKGLEIAGFEHAAFVEFNRHACSSLMVNFDPEKVFFGDIKDFDLNTLSGVEIVAGGPPCQPFSVGGKHKAEKDSRDMFPHAIQAIEKLAPKAFIFENVKGLLRSTFAEYFEYIILRLTFPSFQASSEMYWQDHLLQLRNVRNIPYAGLKYDVKFQLINSADYGIPQTRERVVIVGIRSDLGLIWSFPKTTHNEERLLWEMYITNEYWTRHEISPAERPTIDKLTSEKVARLKMQRGLFEPHGLPWQTIRDALANTPHPLEQNEIQDHVYKHGAKSYAGHTGSCFDWPSKTIKAGGHGVPGGENMIRYPDGSVRYLTVYEAKLIQSFPKEYKIKGAWGEAMRQIGNAVPVKLAEIIGHHLSQLLTDNNKNQSIVKYGNYD